MGILDIGDMRTLKTYFSHLKGAAMINTLSKASEKLSKIESTSKVYLDNTNQLFAITSKTPEKGTIRETFFLNILSGNHEIELPINGDFLIDGTYLFEVGEKTKISLR